MNRSRHTIVIAVAALLLAVSFAGGATAARLVTGQQIKDGTVTSRDVQDRSLKVRDLAPAARDSLRGQQGPAGPAGPEGSDGDTGAPGMPGLDGEDGLDGVSGFQVVSNTTTIAGSLLGVISHTDASCPEGKKAVSATSSFGGALANGLVSQVTRVDDDTFRATGFVALLEERVLRLDVVCATVLP
ncbi:MAG TPA: hypothetical protein VF728_11120 [Nocardioides sp.]